MRSLQSLSQDLRYAARSLRRTPTVTAAAVLTLALGIGAVTIVVSLFKAVLLRELKVASAHQLYFVAHGVGEELTTWSHYPWFEHVRQRTDVFANVTGYNIREFKVASADGLERVVGQYASGSYHAVIGVPFQLGRGFSGEDDRTMSPTAVISDGYWSRRFGRSPDVLGKTITVGGHAVTIVGVTARGFDGLHPGQSVDVTLPLSVRILDDPEFVSRTDTWTSMPLVARLRADVELTQARSVIGAVYREYMSRPGNEDFSRTNGQLRQATLQPAARGSDRLRRDYATSLRALMAMVAVLLLIACLNVANLLLTRAPARAREVAIRMSLGASRRRITLQLLTESALLAVCGGAVGMLLAAWGTELVARILRMGMRPIVIDVQPDRDVTIFALLVSLMTGLAFGLAPAWKTTGIDLLRTLKCEGNARGSRQRRLGQKAVVVVQVALSLVLVFGAALLARTLRNLHTIDGGFRKDGIVLFELDANDTAFRLDRLETLCKDAVNRLMARPGVLSGSCSTMSPVATNQEGRAIVVTGVNPRSNAAPVVFANFVDAGYFETLGIEVRRGETFTGRDTAASPRVAVISEAMARYYFGDRDPINATFRFGTTHVGPPITIVGVVRDARQHLREAPALMAYTPLSQRDEPARRLLATIRTSGETTVIASAVRPVVRELTGDVAVSYVRTMEEQVTASLTSERLLATLSSAFGVLALVLACVGLYGVMSCDVAGRSREIGIRLALGARRSQILRQVLRQAFLVTMVGIGVGAAGAIGASRMLSTVLFGLEPNDPATLMVTIILLGATALLAGFFPARRAAGVDPVVTLRTE